MINILSKYLTTSAQIHNGKCYFVGLISEYDGAANDIEASGTAGTGNQIAMVRREHFGTCILPLPGLKCSNGLYVAVAGLTIVYYYI